MLHLQKYILAVLLSSFAFSCDKYVPEVPLGTIVNLTEGNKAIYADQNTELELEYMNTVEDSRCPLNATCFWEGRFLGRFKLGKDEFVLGIGDLQDSFKQKDTINNYIVTLIEVENKVVNKGYNNNWSPTLKILVDK